MLLKEFCRQSMLRFLTIFFFLHKFYTAIIFAGAAQQTVPPSGASCLLPSLEDVVSVQTLHYHVQVARAKAQEDSRDANRHEGLIVDLSAAGNCSSTTTTSSLTFDSSVSSAALSPPQPIKRQRLAKQASEARVLAKKAKDNYDCRFKLAFKEGTETLHERLDSDKPPSEFRKVSSIVSQLNHDFQLDGRKKLSKSALYRAVSCGHIGASPLKRGPAPRIPDILLDVVARHAEVNQVGDGGELRGRDIKRLMKRYSYWDKV
jgi:hypothetical protein